MLLFFSLILNNNYKNSNRNVFLKIFQNLNKIWFHNISIIVVNHGEIMDRPRCQFFHNASFYLIFFQKIFASPSSILFINLRKSK